MSEFVKIVRLPLTEVASFHLKGESIGNLEDKGSARNGHILARDELVGLYRRR